ncbi:PAS domain S-box protein [Ktedonobacter racemifer]|uniref:histidine kinase n=1 Tax=Ktedonobacter racemifer DSM 44963 TaxID=485913 RepID=D6TWD7_KTERA|nr:PAS domain S-box protein [Ktedonobacter racemifer]EFH84520.1 PAS/PAC sensor signal transduction histidine kinase [Ktedonobacter racemifer DSM 44963]
MSNTKPTKRLTPASSETLLTLLETLPGALFVVDDAAKIVYANASAQTITGATREDVLGKPLWRGAPQLVSTALYQAVQQTRQTQAPSEVEYVSPVTRTWLHVQLSPTVGGLMVQVHQGRAAARREAPVPQDERLSIEDLNGLFSRIGVLTPEGIVLEINEVPLAEARVRREEVIGYPLAETRWWSCSPTSQEQLCAAIARASRGETVRFEAVVHLREGLDRHLEVVITPHRDADHHIAYLIIAGIDITERKRAEAELHALIDAIPQLVWITRPDGSHDSFNQRWRDYTGLSTAEAQGEGWMQCLHPEDRSRVRSAWQHAVQTGGGYETELRLRQGTTGEYRWFLARAMPARGETGQILKWFGTSTDIEEQKRVEQQLKESQESLRVLAETVPQQVWVRRPDGLYEYTNQRWRDYTGLTLEHIQNDRRVHLQFIHPDDQDGHLVHMQHALDTGAMFEYEQRLKQCQTGEYRWFLSRAMPMRDEAGQILKWFGTNTDIEEQKRTEEALRQSQERVNVLMNSSIIGIFFAEDEQVVEANETYLRMTGYSREDLCEGRMNWLHMTPPEYLARTLEAQQELATQQSLTPYEKEYVCKDGSCLPVLVGGVILEHHPLQAIGFVLDNSARKELEQRKDDFISMASHELRNPLTALKLHTTLLHRQLAKQGLQGSAPALSSMETQINKVTRLVEELLDVSKIQAGRLEYVWETVDLDALLREITDTVQQTHPSHRILVRGAVQTSLMADRDRLGQVFTNLLSNAVKYSPSAEAVEMDLSTSAETVTIRVQDHGLGIPREKRDKIFDRFYRVADPRQKAIPGLGMGLYIVAEIVKHYGGTITVESEPGKGSTFQVMLPRKRT